MSLLYARNKRREVMTDEVGGGGGYRNLQGEGVWKEEWGMKRMKEWWDNLKEECKRGVLSFHWVSLIQSNQITYCWENTCMIFCTAHSASVRMNFLWAAQSLVVVFLQLPVRSGAGWRSVIIKRISHCETKWVMVVLFVFRPWIEHDSLGDPVFEHGPLAV